MDWSYEEKNRKNGVQFVASPSGWMELPYSEMVMPEEGAGSKKRTQKFCFGQVKYLLKHSSGEVSPRECAVW